MRYLYEQKNWTQFTWDERVIAELVARASHTQGRLFGLLENVGFRLETQMEVETAEREVVASSLIEGVRLDASKVRSSVARQLGAPDAELAHDTRDVDGAAMVALDAVKRCEEPLTSDRLFAWHSALFPTGYSDLRKIAAGAYRTGSMSVVSGPIGREHVHYQAPEGECVPGLIGEFLEWFNAADNVAPPVRAGIAHLWFLTVHPFDDGNGRIARAIAEMVLARWDASPRRFYSLSSCIQGRREAYYNAIEHAQKGTSDITAWLSWFLGTVNDALTSSREQARISLKREAFWTSLEGAALNDRQRRMLFKLMGGFEGKLTAAKWAKIMKTSPDTALRDINDLIAKGILEKSESGGRSTSYRLVVR